jgi:hypothetical protein
MSVVLCRPAALAESVFGGVKSKMQNLRAALAAKENMLESMAQVRPRVHCNCRPGATLREPLDFHHSVEHN